MKKIALLLSLMGLFADGALQAQKNPSGFKGSGEVFYNETFGWEDPDDPRGWKQPDGYYMEDPTDNGFNFHWWPNDSLNALFVKEPPFQSTSKVDGHLCLFAAKYNDFLDNADATPIDNYIGFPPFDCSDRSSVVVRFETNFMQFGNHKDGMQLMVSNDGGVRWAMFDCDFGVGHKDRPDDVAPGVPAVFQANISEVAAGQPEVLIKFWWHNTVFYYWLIDDFTLSEAWTNDLQMQHFLIEWDDGDENTIKSFTANWPLSQLNGSATGIEASVLNFGEFDQYDTRLEVDISRNGQSVWNASSESIDSWVSFVDTLRIDDSWTPPAEYGHYKFRYEFKSEQEEQTPEDTYREFFMNVTDSVYSRSDDSPELNWSYSFERYADSTDDGMLLDHFVGVEFPIYADCEISSVSVFITGGLADGLIEFAGSVWNVPPEETEEEPYIILTSPDIYVLDSAMFGTWVTMPFEKDGESEFLEAGDVVRAGLVYWNYHQDQVLNRNFGLGMAADKTVPVRDRVSYAFSGDAWFDNDFITKRVLMVRLNLNDDGNIIDNVDLNPNLSSLKQNYPNPFTDRTEVEYSLAAANEVSFEVSDITGRVIRESALGYQIAGRHSVSIDANDYESGIYFYTLKAGDFEQTKRMVIK
jgi:hypothetical protein